jgi:hypothetical protein
MKTLVSYLKSILIFLLLVVLGYSFVEFYPYIFAKTIEGKVEKVERVQLNVSLLQSSGQDNAISPQLYSFAVAIKSDDGVIHTASAEDRQWAAVAEGVCVKAKFFPYPPWKLDKSGTYYGARLLESKVCP